MPHSKTSARNSNTDRLTRGKSIASRKALLKASRAESCTFDPVARAEFLTGFHKRKVERRNAALVKNKEESRQSKLAMRADLRAQRKTELAQRLEAHRAELGLLRPEDGEDAGVETEEWYGFDADSAEAKKKRGLWQVNEYDEDERQVSVTVEAM